MRGARMLLIGSLLVSVAGPAVASAARELGDLTDLVRYLKSRVKHEAPGLLEDRRVLTRLFRDELARFELVLPDAAGVDYASEPLQIATVLQAEQDRRRRSAGRRARIDAADLELSSEVEALLEDAEQVSPELATEVAEIFQAIRHDRTPRGATPASREPRAPGIPMAALPGPSAPPVAPAPRRPIHVPVPAAAVPPPGEAAPRPGRTAFATGGSAASYDDLRAELTDALDESPPTWAPARDPFYGDRSFVVASPRPAPAPVKKVKRVPVDLGRVLRDLRNKVAMREARPAPVVAAAAPARAPVPARAPAPRPVRRPIARPVARRPPPSRPAAKPVAPIRPAPRPAPPKQVVALPPPIAPAAPVAPAPEIAAAADRLVEVLARVVPEVEAQASGDAEYGEALRTTLSILGVEVPAGVRPRRGETPAALAARITRGGEVSVETAVAALGL